MLENKDTFIEAYQSPVLKKKPSRELQSPLEPKAARSQSTMTLSTAISRVRSKLSSMYTLNALLAGK